MYKIANEIIPAKTSYVGERITIDVIHNPDLAPLKVLYITTATYECECGIWARTNIFLNFDKQHQPICPDCGMKMHRDRRTLRPLIRAWHETLGEGERRVQ